MQNEAVQSLLVRETGKFTGQTGYDTEQEIQTHSKMPTPQQI